MQFHMYILCIAFENKKHALYKFSITNYQLNDRVSEFTDLLPELTDLCYVLVFIIFC